MYILEGFGGVYFGGCFRLIVSDKSNLSLTAYSFKALKGKWSKHISLSLNLITKKKTNINGHDYYLRQYRTVIFKSWPDYNFILWGWFILFAFFFFLSRQVVTSKTRYCMSFWHPNQAIRIDFILFVRHIFVVEKLKKEKKTKKNNSDERKKKKIRFTGRYD
jgi:hypothetical protein